MKDMPCKARIDAPGALHHIMVRGIERRVIFRDNRDRMAFLDRLGRVLIETSTPCYAWVLMKNHVHLLLRTGALPIATVMRRVLTGYAQDFNRRYHRHGQLFQNRYKSVLCEEDAYMLELVRYIHLNPLRAGVVLDLDELDRYRFCGHGVLLKRFVCKWQDREYVLGLYGTREKEAIFSYRSFVALGLNQGRRPDLIGGGLVRSAGGWNALKARRRENRREKGDERILGRGEFVERVLELAQEQLEQRTRLFAKGPGLEKLLAQVGDRQGIATEDLRGSSKVRNVVRAKALFCYLAVRKLGYSVAAAARVLGLTPAAVSKAVAKGADVLSATEATALLTVG